MGKILALFAGYAPERAPSKAEIGPMAVDGCGRCGERARYGNRCVAGRWGESNAGTGNTFPRSDSLSHSAKEIEQMKHAPAVPGVIEEILERWSPRAFSHRAVAGEDLKKIFEAARWAASSYNEQPWRFLVAIGATKPTRRFSTAWWSSTRDGRRALPC